MITRRITLAAIAVGALGNSAGWTWTATGA